MKKDLVILHIGLHKTGSTTIQAFLADNRIGLNDLDYVCYDTEGKYHNSGNAYFLVKKNNWFNDKRDLKLDISLLIENINKSHSQRVMISSEALSWCSDIEQLKRLKNELLAVTNKVLVLVYVREFLSFVTSNFCEGLKYPTAVSVLTNYDYPCLSLDSLKNDLSREHYTYKNILAWQTVFGNSLKAIEFSPNSWVQKNLIVDLLHQIGLGGDNRLEGLAKHYQHKNQSYNLLQVYYLVRIHRIANLLGGTHAVKTLLSRTAEFAIKLLQDDRKFTYNKSYAEDTLSEFGDDLSFARQNLGLCNANYLQILERHKDVDITGIDKFKCVSIVPLHLLFIALYPIAYCLESVKKHFKSCFFKVTGTLAKEKINL